MVPVLTCGFKAMLGISTEKYGEEKGEGIEAFLFSKIQRSKNTGIMKKTELISHI